MVRLTTQVSVPHTSLCPHHKLFSSSYPEWKIWTGRMTRRTLDPSSPYFTEVYPHDRVTRTTDLPTVGRRWDEQPGTRDDSLHDTDEPWLMRENVRSFQFQTQLGHREKETLGMNREVRLLLVRIGRFFAVEEVQYTIQQKEIQDR